MSYSATVGQVRRTRVFAAAAIAVLLLSGAVALRSHGAAHGKTGAQVLGEEIFGAQPISNGKPTTSTTVKASSKFSVQGSIEDLYPGAPLPLDLTLTNETGSTISVTSLVVAVGDASS